MRASGLNSIQKNKSRNFKRSLFVALISFYFSKHILGFIDLFWQLRIIFYGFCKSYEPFQGFVGFGILPPIKIHFSQIKIIFIEIGSEIYSRLKVLDGFFGIAAKKKRQDMIRRSPIVS